MPYEPLHHKYRPQTFAQLVGQEAIATTLSNALEQRRIAPAYLFSGPRGTGKTSSARILAKSLNCLNSENPTPSPCGECEVCRAIANGSAMDVIEIDAASNTGVDNIRELIERSQFSPVQCRYKVYVIDECHMLSVAAFNALLKTLEEPPNHVVFVLATTDPQRVLPTIISRCQRFDYRRIPLDAMVGHLQKIAHIENIEIPVESVTLIAQIANGGLRDAESLLDQLSLLAGEITPDRVWDLVGAVPERDLLALIQVIRGDRPEAVIHQCRSLLNRGREPLVVLQNLASFYLNLLIAKTAPQRGDLIAVTQPTWQELCEEGKAWDLRLILKGQQHLKDSEYQLKNTTQPRLWLEITLLGLLPSSLTNLAMATTEVVVRPPATQTISQPAKMPAPAQEKAPPTTPAPSHPFGETPATPPQATPAIAPPPIPEPLPAPPQNAPRESQPSAVPEPVAPPPEMTTTSPSISALEREQLWETMIAQLQPVTTQQLLRQQGCLVSIQGNMALVGIRSQPLLGIAKSKQSNIEAAFQKACQRPIRVSFQIGHESAGEMGDSGAIAPSVQPSAPISTPPPAPKPTYANPEPFTAAQTPPPSVPQSVPAPAQIRQPPPPPPAVVAPTSEISPVETAPVLEEPETEGDRHHAITQQFAEFFAGEVIELEHFAPEEMPADANIIPIPAEPAPPPQSGVALNVQGRPPVTTSIDEDIPF